uniref:G_PROTEIN_RECEP_F1_2 domain-containing protein n=1 Tax=Heterorhabditis bacteriophora TaxID=37862 RepID=A0A1I7XN67_HETBA
MVISFNSYRYYQDSTFPLAFLVVLNSVINPFIYGRCQGLKLMFSCNQIDKKPKTICRFLRR